MELNTELKLPAFLRSRLFPSFEVGKRADQLTCYGVGFNQHVSKSNDAVDVEKILKLANSLQSKPVFKIEKP